MSVAEQNVQTAVPVGTFEVDAGHSTVGFRVTETKDLIATVTGRFTKFEGTFELAEAPDASRVSGVIETSSIVTDDEKRDQHLQSPDFFDASTYPEIRFESTRVEHLGGDRFRIAGVLSIKDFSHEIELDTRLVASGTDRHGNDRIAFESRGELEWGPFTVQVEADVSAVKQG